MAYGPHRKKPPTQAAILGRAEPVSSHGEMWLTSAQVRARQGNISDMTLWRWTHDPDIRFPEPDDKRNGRKYWKLSTVQKWEAERAFAKEAA